MCEVMMFTRAITLLYRLNIGLTTKLYVMKFCSGITLLNTKISSTILTYPKQCKIHYNKNVYLKQNKTKV